MKNLFNLSKLFLVLALLPASASALTITIAAPTGGTSIVDVTMTGDITLGDTENYYPGGYLLFRDIGNYVNFREGFSLTSGITMNGSPVTSIEFLHNDPVNGASDDLELTIPTFSGPGTYSFSGSATANLREYGDDYNFGDLNTGIYSLDGLEGYPVRDTGHELIIQYNSVPDTGSTAAFLGAGVAALAFVRRRLG